MLGDGQMTEVQVDGTAVLLARADGAYYAASALCPHMGAHLAQGRLDGFVVTCPRHGSRFDLRSGHNQEWIPKIPGLARGLARAVKRPSALRTFATRVADDQVWVDLL
jgi:nitrite reductase/ring-hydroxylating ferredoxin subunit